ncbi:cell wall metabolism sensor histidine kinase WalK [Halobacillus sp. KGW1]|uniref:sensor histidine kinase n=1 Tax=Halobacillus sp. KGW1 TaxID=1793726 RepID=UPI000783FE14|nr:HAMP domain-containing sensor histidine kinase [Halobacillus sp. KGW1]
MKTLYSKFLWTTLFIMIGSAVTGFLLSNLYYQNELKPENDTKNTKIALQMAAYGETEKSLEDFLQHTASTGYQLYLFSEKEGEQYFGRSFNEHNLPASAVSRVIEGDIYHGMRDFPKETFVTGFFANELRNTVGVPLTYEGTRYALFMRPDIELLFNELHILLAWMVAAIVLLSLAAMLIWSGLIIHPIRKLTAAVNKVGEEGFGVYLKVTRKDEIGQLARRFNDMITRLGKLDEMRKSFVSNVSHDIRTPLSNIQGYSRLLENDNLPHAERQKYLAVIQEEAERMSALSSQLLTLSSLSPEEENIKKSPVDVSGQLKQLIRRYHWRIDEAGMSISYNLDEMICLGNEALLYTVWENLLTNAIKYNSTEGTISIQGTATADEINVSITDCGIGLSEEEQEQVFDRFYRADQARSRSVPGTGLGLSIVKEIIDLHDGSVHLHSEPGSGSTFLVTLPRL